MTGQDVYDKYFDSHKSKQDIDGHDLSRKSSVDAYIQDLIEFINKSKNFFTTSSCSGRFIAYSLSDASMKKNCKWIHVAHDRLDDATVEKVINDVERDKSECHQINLKFEPFILHVCCRNLSYAKLMLDNAIANGFKNSGLSLGNSKIILAVRSTQSLEVPVTDSGKMLVDHSYIRYLCGLVNGKFDENFNRIDKYYNYLKTHIDLAEAAPKKSKDKSQHQEKRQQNQTKYDGDQCTDISDSFDSFLFE